MFSWLSALLLLMCQSACALPVGVQDNSLALEINGVSPAQLRSHIKAIIALSRQVVFSTSGEYLAPKSVKRPAIVALCAQTPFLANQYAIAGMWRMRDGPFVGL